MNSKTILKLIVAVSVIFSVLAVVNSSDSTYLYDSTEVFGTNGDEGNGTSCGSSPEFQEWICFGLTNLSSHVPDGYGAEGEYTVGNMRSSIFYNVDLKVWRDNGTFFQSHNYVYSTTFTSDDANESGIYSNVENNNWIPLASSGNGTDYVMYGDCFYAYAGLYGNGTLVANTTFQFSVATTNCNYHYAPQIETNDEGNETQNEITEIGGCIDFEATNYNPSAGFDDGSCTYPEDNTTSELNTDKEDENTFDKLIETVDENEYKEEAAVVGVGAVSVWSIGRIRKRIKNRSAKLAKNDFSVVKNAYNLVKENPLKDKQRSAESLKKAYEGLKGEVEENKAKKIKELVAESDHYFRTGRDRQVAMSISSDKRLDEYEENN